MSLNEFVLALSGVILGLGIADLLASLHRLLRAGSRVKWDWLTLLFAAYVLFGLIIFWWWQYGFPGAGKTLTVFQYLPNFAFLALSFLMAASALPDDVPSEGLDLRDFYSETVTYRWGLLTASMVGNLAGLLWQVLTSDTPYWLGLGVVGVAVLLACAAMRFRARWFHGLVLACLFTLSGLGAAAYAIGP